MLMHVLITEYLFTFIAEIIDKVEMASAKMSPCFTTIMAQLMNDENKIGIPICFQTDVILGRFHNKKFSQFLKSLHTGIILKDSQTRVWDFIK